jgi:hypothetical protein
VTFLFPTSMEIHYLEQLPKRGDRLRGTRDGTCVVSGVEADGTGTYTATCVRPREFVRDARRTRPRGV